VAATRAMELLPGDIGPTGRPLPHFPVPEPLATHGPARIVAVCNQKGGVGKTTTTINLGAALAEQGRRCLLVDFDPQGALSVGLGIQPHDIDMTVYNLLMERGVNAHDVLFNTGVENLDLLPSNIDLSGAEVQLVSEVGREFILGGALKPVVPDYDYILIDCQPSLGLLTINALACATSVLIPLECEYFAMRGVALLMETIDKVKQRLNPNLMIDGLLGTMYDSRTLHTREVLGSVVNGFSDKVFHTVINRTVRFPDATVAGEPITSFDSGSMGANSYRELAKEVLERWRQTGDGHAELASPGSRSCCAPPHPPLSMPVNGRRPAGKGTTTRSPSTCPPPSCSTLSTPGWRYVGSASSSTVAGSSARPSPSCSPTWTPAAGTAC
jgi:chromosome partitioning protein